MKFKFIFMAALLQGGIAFSQITKGTITINGSIGIDGDNGSLSRTESSTVAGFEADDYPTTNEREISLSVGPNCAYFFKDNLSIGLALDYSGTAQKNTNYYYNANTGMYQNISGLKSRMRSYGAGVLLTKYYPLGEKVYFSLAGGLFYDNSKSFSENIYSRTNNSLESEYFAERAYDDLRHNLSFRANPGLLLKPNKKWGLSLIINGAIALNQTFNTTRFYAYGGSFENPEVETMTQKSSYSSFSLGLSTFSPGVGFTYFIGPK